MNFLKMHGLGNDFVILDQRSGVAVLAAETIEKLCDRHFGVGCDQLIVMEPSKKADLFMRIYNPDASESEACGNATRCVAHLYMKEAGAERCTIETLRGVLSCRLVGNELVEVDMGEPLEVQELEGTKFKHGDPVTVNMGNPHCVFFIADVEKLDLEKIGPPIESHKLFPNRTNVEFVEVLPDGGLRQRTWERGAGETLACGSGACAVGVAAIHQGFVDERSVEITLNGGTLSIEWREDDNHVLMTGPVAYVFDGRYKV